MKKRLFVQEKIDNSPTFFSSSPIKNDRLRASYAFVNVDYPKLHGHSNYCEILFVYKGCLNNYVNGEWRKMSAGDCCLILKGDTHKFVFENTQECSKDVVAINFLIHEDYFEKLKLLCDDDVAKDVFVTTKNQKIFHVTEQDTNSIYKKALSNQIADDSYVREYEINSKLLIVRLLRRYIDQYYNVENKVVPDWILQLLADIQNPDNMSKSMTEYIANVPYCYSYIAKEFKEYMGCTMINHITSVKLNYAAELLARSELSNLEICVKLGYNSLSHFNHIFKKFFGKPPSYYRKHNI